MKGYKGFHKGMICSGSGADGKDFYKKYKENTVYEEDEAVVCRKGMHFCENPLDVLCFYPPVDENGDFNEFAEVEALDDPKTDDNIKFCSTKLKIGAKLSFTRLVQAFVDFTLERVKDIEKRQDCYG